MALWLTAASRQQGGRWGLGACSAGNAAGGRAAASAWQPCLLVHEQDAQHFRQVQELH